MTARRGASPGWPDLPPTERERLLDDLETLGARIEAEERADRRQDALRRRKGQPEPPRRLLAYPGFASSGTPTD